MSEETRCRICGRRLTIPESVKRGIGPVCLSRLKMEIEEDDARFAAEQEAEQDRLRGEAEAQAEAEAREQDKIAREEEERERWSTGPEGEPEA